MNPYRSTTIHSDSKSLAYYTAPKAPWWRRLKLLFRIHAVWHYDDLSCYELFMNKLATRRIKEFRRKNPTVVFIDAPPYHPSEVGRTKPRRPLPRPPIPAPPPTNISE